jgi:transposase
VKVPRFDGDLESGPLWAGEETIVMVMKKYPAELRERAVRLYRETSPTPTISSVARKLGVGPEALRQWIRQDEADRGTRSDRPTTEERELVRQLRRENEELKRINEILRLASSFFASELGQTRRWS